MVKLPLGSRENPSIIFENEGLRKGAIIIKNKHISLDLRRPVNKILDSRRIRNLSYPISGTSALLVLANHLEGGAGLGVAGGLMLTKNNQSIINYMQEIADKGYKDGFVRPIHEDKYKINEATLSQHPIVGLTSEGDLMLIRASKYEEAVRKARQTPLRNLSPASIRGYKRETGQGQNAVRTDEKT